MTLDYIFEKCTGHKPEYWLDRDELDWYDDYAATNRKLEGKKGLLVADWNNFPHGGRQWVKGIGYPDAIVTPYGLKQNGTSSSAMHRFDRILEKAGYALDWSDEISRCDDCGLAIHTTADSYDWTPDYWVSDGEIICEESVHRNFTDEYLTYQSKHKQVVLWDDLDFRGNDWYPVADEYPVEVSNPAELYRQFNGRNIVVVDTRKSDVYHLCAVYEKVKMGG